MNDGDSHDMRKERFWANARAQFELLGRFVQAFEEMVGAARTGCLFLIAGSNPLQHRLLSIALHHRAMSAMPIFEIFRATASTILREEEIGITKNDISTLNKILGQIQKDYAELTKKRNDFLHGLWGIGWGDGVSEPEEDLRLLKMKVGASGLYPVNSPIPVLEIENCIAECKTIHDMIHSVVSNITLPSPGKINIFIKEEGRWRVRKRQNR